MLGMGLSPIARVTPISEEEVACCGGSFCRKEIPIFSFVCLLLVAEPNPQSKSKASSAGGKVWPIEPK